MRAAAALLASVLAWSAGAAETNAPIQVTINPEGRVSAALVGALPPPASCGSRISMSVLVRNESFSTSSLQALLVGDVPEGVTLALEPATLTGKSEQVLALTLFKAVSGASDVTISFRTTKEPPDLGGRDRIHFIVRCSS